MATKPTPTKGQPSACFEIPSYPPVEVSRAVLGQIFDKLMTAQRLALVSHRIGAEGNPETLLAWEMFLAINTACDMVGTLAGYDPADRDPE